LFRGPTVRVILLKWFSEGERNERSVLSVMKKWKAPTECCSQYPKGTDHLGDIGENGKVIFKCIFEKEVLKPPALKCIFEKEVLKPPATYTQMNDCCFIAMGFVNTAINLWAT
jgi:hypothetical protein